jgi:kynurenine formamidase
VEAHQGRRGETEGGYFYASNDFEASEHGGTHLDAPIHFARGGWTSAEIRCAASSEAPSSSTSRARRCTTATI